MESLTAKTPYNKGDLQTGLSNRAKSPQEFSQKERRSLYSGASHSEVNPFRINPRYVKTSLNGSRKQCLMRSKWAENSPFSDVFLWPAAIFAPSPRLPRAQKRCTRPFRGFRWPFWSRRTADPRVAMRVIYIYIYKIYIPPIWSGQDHSRQLTIIK